MRVYYVPINVLGTGNSAVNMTETKGGLTEKRKNTDNKLTKKDIDQIINPDNMLPICLYFLSK